MANSNKPVDSKSPAVAVAHENLSEEDGFVTLSNGARAMIRPVSISLITEVSNRVKDPEVPTFYNEEKGRDEPNPNHPSYIRALQEAENRRGIASLDAMVMFGIELVDGLPKDEKWIKKLRTMERIGALDLSVYDLEDDIDKEFLYKRFIAVGTEDLAKISRASGISQEAVESAEKSF